MNSKLEKGKEGGKKRTASPKKNPVSPKAPKSPYEEDVDDDWENSEMDEFDQEPDVFDDLPDFQKKVGSGKKTKKEDPYDFDDDIRGLGFLDDSFYDDDDDLY